MSSVQGSQSITTDTVDRVRTLLEQINGDHKKPYVQAPDSLRRHLESKVQTKESAAALYGELGPIHGPQLEREVANFPPALQNLFKDAFGFVHTPEDDINSPAHAKKRKVRVDGDGRIAGGQVVTPASVQNVAAGQPVGATSRPRGPVRVVEDDPAAAAAAAAAGPSANRARGANKPQRPAEPKTVDGAANSDAAGQVHTAPASEAVDQVSDSQPSQAADGGATSNASGAPRMPDEIAPLFERVMDHIHACLDPRANEAYAEAQKIASNAQGAIMAYNSMSSAAATLTAIPKKDRTEEQTNELIRLKKALRGTKPPVELEKALSKASEELAAIPNRVGFLEMYFGLNRGRALDQETPEGRETLAIIDEIFGRDSDLAPETKAKIKAFRETPKGQEVLGLAPPMDAVRALAFDKVKQSPELGAVFDKVAAGESVSEAEVRKILGMPPPEDPHTATTKSAPSTGGPNGPRGPGAPPPPPPSGPSGPNGPNGPNDQDKWFNPMNRNWFGLSRVRHDQLRSDGHGELLQAIQDYNTKTQAAYMTSGTRLQSMMTLLNSGLPIEAILLMFMGLMTENEEEKLKLKMAELVVAEQFERTNRKLQADQNFARDLVKKYGAIEGVPAEQRENINKAQLEKMAGLEWTQGVSTEDALRDNARGAIFKKLRAEGIGADKLATVTFADGKLDEAALRELGIDPDKLRQAGVHDEASWEQLKVVAPEISDKDIEDLSAKKRIESESRFIDVTLNPMDFGFTTKPSQALVQELQVQMQSYKQMMETFTAVIRMLQDIVARIVQNIR